MGVDEESLDAVVCVSEYRALQWWGRKRERVRQLT